MVFMRAVLSAFLTALSLSAVAQQGFFIKAAYAWNWAASSNVDVRFPSPVRLGGFPYNMWHDARVATAPGTFSGGQAAWMEAGYRLSERLGFGLGLRHVFAPTTQRATVDYQQLGFPGETILERRAEKPLFLEPGVTVFLPLGNKAEAHFRAGALVPLRHTIRSASSTFDTTVLPYWQTVTELRTRFGIGAFGGLGVTATVGAGFGIFLQGDFGLLSLRTRDETVLIAVFESANGSVNFTEQLSEAERRVEYLDGAVLNPSAVVSMPSVRPTYLVPFNFWSAELGVRWALAGD